MIIVIIIIIIIIIMIIIMIRAALFPSRIDGGRTACGADGERHYTILYYTIRCYTTTICLPYYYHTITILYFTFLGVAQSLPLRLRYTRFANEEFNNYASGLLGCMGNTASAP